MDEFARRVRKQRFWKTRSEMSFRKLSPKSNLPFDEINLYKDVSSDFHKFIFDLINRSNTTFGWGFSAPKVNSIHHSAQSDFDQLADEREGFNFLTCVTSDTFWSIAKMFTQPYQPPVWISVGLGAALVTTVILLAVGKLFGKIQILISRLGFHVLFNLIEIGVSPGKLPEPEGKSSIKMLLAAWLLVSIILTNSYKGLVIVISYLSVPWAPEQDFHHFHQMTQFRFYSRVPPAFDSYYWKECKELKDGLETRNNSCHQMFTPLHVFGVVFTGFDWKGKRVTREHTVNTRKTKPIKCFGNWCKEGK